MSNNIPKLSQWQMHRAGQQQQQAQQQQPQQQQVLVANYTLPGVINYLTSEFTNLERFKIMTNLEKSEMKYRITQLQGELNSLRYVNEQQKNRIERLEKELAQYKEHGVPDEKSDLVSMDLPEVDLQLIKNSRYQLTKSMREVIHLLKTPTDNNLDYLNLPEVNDTVNSFDELFNSEKANGFSFNGSSTSNERKAPKNYFNSSEDDILNDSSVRAKFDDMSLNDSSSDVNNVEESDTETVILDGSNELKFDTETGSIEPTINLDAPIDYKLANELNLVLCRGAEKVRVFSNPLNDVLVSINYDDPEEPDRVRITLYAIDTKSELAVFNSTKGNLDDINDILHLYCLKHDTNQKRAHLLIINKCGEVNQMVLDEEDPVTTLVLNLAAAEGGLDSSAIVEFKHKSNETTRHYGLAISMSSKAFKVFELVTGPRNSLNANEIGNYTKAFFKSIKAKETGKFEAVKWFMNKVTKEVSPSKFKKAHKKTSSCSDVSLSPYQIVLKLDTTIFTLNIVAKTYVVISDYVNALNPALETNIPYLVAASEIDKTSFQIEVFDLNSGKSHNMMTIEEELTDDKVFTVVMPRSSNNYFIVSLSNDTLALYTHTYKLLDSQPVRSNKAYVIGDAIAIQSKSSLSIYSPQP